MENKIKENPPQRKTIFEMSSKEALTEKGMKTYIDHYKEWYIKNGKNFDENVEREIRENIKKTYKKF
jgi:hypothetical protein